MGSTIRRSPLHEFGQPRYQISNVHTLQGIVVDDPTGAGVEANG